MKNIKLCLVVIWGFLCLDVVCQNKGAEWSEPIKASSNNSSIFTSLGWNNSSYYFIQSNVGNYGSKGSYLNSLTADSRKENRIKLALPKMSSAAYIVKNDSGFMLIGPVHRDDQTKVMVYQFGYDAVLKSKVEIAQFPIPYGTYFNYGIFDNYYPLIGRSANNSISPDEALISCAYIRLGRNSKYKQNNSKLEVCVFNRDDLTPLFSSTLIFKEHSQYVYISGQQIDKEGNLSVIVSFIEHGSKSVRDYIYSFNKNGDFLGRKEMFHEGNRLYNLQMLVTSEGKVKMMGAYNQKQADEDDYVKSSEEDSINSGFFLADFDIQSQIVKNLSLGSLEEESLKLFSKTNEPEKEDYFQLKYIADFHGGGYLIRERRYTVSTSSLEGPSTVLHYAKELLVAHFNKYNELATAHVLVKSQRSLRFSRSFMHYFSYVDQDGLHLYYNKLRSNGEEKGKSLNFPKTNKNAIVANGLINSENQLINLEELNSSKIQGFLIPNGCFSNEEKALLYFGWGKFRKIKVIEH